jgi:cyclomaltodextrinase / maltogenic alpha-amylase / neopullulanase
MNGNPEQMDDMKLGKYRHYKGRFYEVIGIAKHSETLEEMVVYRALYESDEFGKNALWVRPRSMFLEKINVDGKKVSRFTFVG